MAALRFLAVAYKLKRGWSRIPPAQRERIVKQAGKTVRKHGPTVAKEVSRAVRQARKAR